MECPKCKHHVDIIKETDLDTFYVYMYPLCRNCGWYSMPVFDNKMQIEVYLENLKWGAAK